MKSICIFFCHCVIKLAFVLTFMNIFPIYLRPHTTGQLVRNNPRLVEGGAQTARLENKWDDYLKHAKLQ